MQKVLKAQFEIFKATTYRVGLVVAQFNRDITDELLKNAQAQLSAYEVAQDMTTIHFVAGSIEIPVVLQALAKTKQYDCLVTLGAVIRGETAHFDYVCKIVSEGVLRVMLDYGLPVGFGILTLENKVQALARFQVGAEAVVAALETARVLEELDKKI